MGLQPRFLQGWQEDSRTSAAVQFGKPIARYLKPSAAKWRFHCMVIAAHRGDGITTAAKQAEQYARDIVGPQHVALLTGDNDDRPRLAIADLLSPRTIDRAARRARVDLALPLRRRSVRAMLAAVGAFILSAAVTLLGSILADGTLTAAQTRRVLTKPWYLVFALVAAAAGLVIDRLLRERPRATGKRLAHVTELTATIDAPPAAREQFISLLANALLDDRDRRCLIVDDFARLDAISQAVIRRALETASGNRSELWIVFESAGLSAAPTFPSPSPSPSPTLIGELGRHVLAKRQSSPASAPTAPSLRSNATLLFELLHLTAEQRRQLAEDLALASPESPTQDAVHDGRTVSPGYLIVKDIVSGGVSEAERAAFEQTWSPQTVRADIALHEALELVYLLSISAPPGYAVTFPLRRLPAELSATGAHREVLQQILRTPPTLDTITRRLENALRIFTRFVEQDQIAQVGAPDVLRLSPAIQDVLTSRNGAYDLPGVGIVHLFWALYRFDRGSPDRTTWIEPQTRHLREAADPSAVGSPEVAATFGAALLAVIDACADLGRLGDAINLLNRAYDLGAEPGFPLEPAALHKRTRALYALSADPKVLARAAQSLPNAPSDLPATAIGDEPADEPPTDPLIELFQQATPGAANVAQLCEADRLLDIDLRLRAAWLALSLQPLAGPALPRDLPLSRTIIDTHLSLPLLTQFVFDESNAGERSLATLASLTTALWCLALADETLTGPILSRIDTGSGFEGVGRDFGLSAEEWSQWTSSVDVHLAEGLEHGLYIVGKTASTAASGPSYAHAGARSELLVTVVAAAIRIRLTWTSLQRARERQLDRIILDGCRELGITLPRTAETQTAGAAAGAATAETESTPAPRMTRSTLLTLAERVAKRMRTIQITWTALGYPRAAVALNTRRVQFLAGLPGVRSRDAEAAMGDRAGNDLFGFIANLAVAGDSAAHLSVRAEIVAAAVGRLLLTGQFDERLAAQLCFLVIRLASSFAAVDTRRHLRYLADPPDSPTIDDGPTRLDAVLLFISEDELDYPFLVLLNAANTVSRLGHDEGDQTNAVIRALRRRLADVVDPVVAQQLRTRLDLYELMRAVSSGDTPNVDGTLDAWRDRKTVPGYAFVLYLLAPPQNTSMPERLRQEIGAVLRDPHIYFSETGISLLANRAARAQQAQSLTMTAAESADLVRVLRARAHRVGHPSGLPLAEATDTLRHLFRLDPGNALQYRAPMLDLQRNALRLLGEQQLARLLAERQDKALLRAYLEMFQEFLPVAETDADADAAADDSGNGQLTAFVGPGQRMLNADYLRALFDSRTDEQFRARLDAQTRNLLIRVLTLLSEVPDMPADMAQLLREHRARVQETAASDVSL